MNSEERIETISDLAVFINEFYGYKASEFNIMEPGINMECLLYDSFTLRGTIDEKTRSFRGGILFNDKGGILKQYLGRPLLATCTKKAMAQNLEMIDMYCRLRLPDKYLNAYEKVCGGSHVL